MEPSVDPAIIREDDELIGDLGNSTDLRGLTMTVRFTSSNQTAHFLRYPGEPPAPLLGVISATIEAVTLGGHKLVAFVQEIDHSGCGFSCGIAPVVLVQQSGEPLQGLRLSHHVTESLTNR